MVANPQSNPLLVIYTPFLVPSKEQDGDINKSFIYEQHCSTRQAIESESNSGAEEPVSIPRHLCVSLLLCETGSTHSGSLFN